MLCLSRDLRGFCAFWGVLRRDGVICRLLSRRRESWLRGSCPPPEAAASPLGAELLLFLACCRARSTGVRPPPLAAFGDNALGALYDAKTQSGPGGLQDAPSCRFRAARPTSGAGGLQIAAYDTNLKVWHREIPVTAVLSPSILDAPHAIRRRRNPTGRFFGGVRLLLGAPGCVCAGVPINPDEELGASLSQRPPAFSQNSSI